MRKISLVFIFHLFLMALQAQTAFDLRMSSLGYDQIITDWSDSVEINIPMPTCAYINITGVKQMPRYKGVAPLKAYMEIYDGNGNYFKKRILLKCQGNSTKRFDKKSFGANFCEDEWLEEETTDITIGDWVPQDGFHWKAFYSDYFRGLGTLNYKFYDEIISDRPRPWSEAAEQGKFPQALGHIDGFPSVVYLNGAFYGLFSCELKKNRKNMNMVKDVPEHIFIDAGLSQNLLAGNVTWTFQVRNPKDLYTMDGEIYDKDHPKELIDSTSAFYNLDTDTKNIKKRKAVSAQVKQYILNFSKHYNQITAMRNARVSADVIKDTLRRQWDIPAMIDFWLFSLVTSNYDNFNSDYLWTTYDGVKWTLQPYDLDVTYGYHNYGFYLFPPQWTTFRGPMTYKIGFAFVPFKWIGSYFLSEVKQRYAQLRQSGVISTDNMMAIIDNWRYRYGEENYRLEWEKWPESPGITPLVLNENWSDPNTWSGYKEAPAYSDTVTYNAGDHVSWSFKKWTATGTTKGVKPASQLGCQDSPERIRDWIEKRIAYEDGYMDYTFESLPMSVTLGVSSAGWSTVCFPFKFSIPDNMSIYRVTGVDSKGKLVTEQVSETEANKPYLVQGWPGSYVLSGYTEEASESDADYLVNGLLKGTLVSQYVPKGNYVLQNHNSNIAFYLVDQDGTVKSSPYRAWLVNPQLELSSNVLTFDQNYSTAVDLTETHPLIEGIYGLDGNKRNQLQKGINIVKYSDGKNLKISQQ